MTGVFTLIFKLKIRMVLWFHHLYFPTLYTEEALSYWSVEPIISNGKKKKEMSILFYIPIEKTMTA